MSKPNKGSRLINVLNITSTELLLILPRAESSPSDYLLQLFATHSKSSSFSKMFEVAKCVSSTFQDRHYGIFFCCQRFERDTRIGRQTRT